MNVALDAGGCVVGVLADALTRTANDPEVRRAVADERLCLATPYAPSAPFSAGNAMGRNKILYALAYREDPVKPSFVVDISDTFDTKMTAIRCYSSQFDGALAAGEIFPTGQDLYELIRIQSAHYGSLIRKPYGEPFFMHETVAIDDVLTLGVSSL